MFWHKKDKQKQESGVVIVEAAISLPVFIFAIFIILSVIDICYVQSKMSVALNSASKEMSQYAYLYSTLNMDKYMSGEGGKSSEFMESFGKVLGEISDGTSNFSTDISDLFKNASETAGGDSAAEYIKDTVGMGLAKQLVKKNLVSYKGDTAENFLKRNHVVNGINGLNFAYTSFLTDADQSEVDIIVTYQVQVVKLLNMDFKYKFLQRARSKAWGEGISLKNPESATSSGSIWDANDLSRGKIIIKNEKEKYSYTSDKNGFHVFDPEKNEYIRIRSIDITESSYSNQEKGKQEIKNTLQSSFNTMYQGVSKLGNPVTVKNAEGQSVTKDSAKESRTYRIVVVIPERTDTSLLNDAIREFEAQCTQKGEKVVVEVKAGYGSVTPKEETSENK